jgi:integrase
MSVYSVKGKGWRYDFTLKGTRHTEAWFKTKKEAAQAEARRREELNNPKPVEATEISTDITFLDLVNRRLDHVKAYNSDGHYEQYIYKARMWVKEWPKMTCAEITRDEVETFLLKRQKTSPALANVDLRYLRALFNFGVERKLIPSNPTDEIKFFPVEKKKKYVPMPDDIDLVIEVADCDTQDYLWVMRETMGRMSEINRLTWVDVNFAEKSVTLYTRKKKGGHLTPRDIPMTTKLFEVLSKRYDESDPAKSWVFWHEYVSSKTKSTCVGPYRDRKKFMRTLCKEAGVRYFRFHALRHAGASLMGSKNIPIPVIQQILGHEDRETTAIYVHSLSGASHQAMAIYEAARQSHTQSLTQTKKGL